MSPGTAKAREIRFSTPLIGEAEIGEVVDTLRGHWITTGPKTHAFERDFAHYLDASGALALNSCTAGLHTALLALGIGPGDEVITSSITFAATANVIEHVGPRPVLVDVEPDTLNLDPAQIERAVTARTRAILPVHYAGHPAEMDTIEAIAAAAGLAVVEDAAHALPAKYKGRPIGSGPNPTAFSFYATKNLTTAEGGMLTGDSTLLQSARVLSLHGMSRDGWNRYDGSGSWHYDVAVPGFKYNMTDLQAALGLWQLRRLPDFQRRRRQVVAAYDEAFRGTDALQVPTARPEVEHAWHLYVLRLRNDVLSIGRDQFVDALTARGVGTSVHFVPIHLHSYYRRKYGYLPGSFPVALNHFQRMFSLPLSPALSDDDIHHVIDSVLDVVARHRRRRRPAA